LSIALLLFQETLTLAGVTGTASGTVLVEGTHVKQLRVTSASSDSAPNSPNVLSARITSFGCKNVPLFRKPK
jgi:hypothetical protein